MTLDRVAPMCVMRACEPRRRADFFWHISSIKWTPLCAPCAEELAAQIQPFTVTPVAESADRPYECWAAA